MQAKLPWYKHFAVNSYTFGLSIASGILTPLLLPYLVVQFMPPEYKNTYLANLRVIGLAVAMFIQPLAGMISDRSGSAMGRRRPFIIGSAIFNILFLAVVGASPAFKGSALDAGFLQTFGVTTAYLVLLAGIVLMQVSSNFGQAALQGLIPDVVPTEQRGFSSGTKSVLDLLPVFLVIFVGPMVDQGRVWVVVAIMMLCYAVTAAITGLWVKENRNPDARPEPMLEPVLRLLALTVIFVGITRVALWLVTAGGAMVKDAPVATQALVIGLAGLLGMAGSIFTGVYFGAWVGIGKDARSQTSFIWWVINRLLFLASVGSIQGFAQYYLKDVIKVPNPATMTTILLAVVALFLMPSALYGGSLGDRMGRKRLLVGAGVVAALGTLVLLFATGMPMVIAAGCLIGLATGTFMATNWALGTDLVPQKDAGKYLGISNLAGAGAGIVGAGIGGPMADSFNLIQPGLGYIVIFAIYGAMFLISILTLAKVKEGKPAQAGSSPAASLSASK